MAVGGILFSAPMVRATIDGRKTQTRRILKPQPQILDELASEEQESLEIENRLFGEEGRWIVLAKPLPDEVGVLRWVREPWRTIEDWNHRPPRDLPPAVAPIQYEATQQGQVSGKLRPGMFLPRWASRLTLEVTAVRVERLQDISEADAVAEGAYPCEHGWSYGGSPLAGATARGAYYCLWESINGAGSWAANPWVIVRTFDVIKANIDVVLTNRETGG